MPIPTAVAVEIFLPVLLRPSDVGVLLAVGGAVDTVGIEVLDVGLDTVIELETETDVYT